MKKLILLSIIPLLFIFCSSNKNKKEKIKNDIQNENLLGKIKCVTQHTFNVTEKFGEIVKDKGVRTCGSNMLIYKLDGNENIQVVFNESGNIVEANTLCQESLIKEYLLNGYDTINNRHIMKYDDNGNKIEWTIYSSKVSIENKYTYKYDLKNNLIEQIAYNSKGSIVSKFTFEYDKNQNQISKNSFDKEDKLNYKKLSKFDDDNNLIETVEFYTTEHDSTKYSYKYDDNNNEIEENCYRSRNKSNSKQSFKYKYDDDKNITECLVYGSDSSLLSKCTLKYNDKGQVIERTISGNVSNKTISYTTTYDNSGNVLEEPGQDNDGKPCSHEYKYEFDKNGNWIKRTEYQNGIPKILTERVIEYY